MNKKATKVAVAPKPRVARASQSPGRLTVPKPNTTKPFRKGVL